MHPVGDHGVAGSILTGSSNSSFMEVDNETFSSFVISLPLSPEWQLLVFA